MLSSQLGARGAMRRGLLVSTGLVMCALKPAAKER
jgi:hypothetical protein